MESVVRIVVEPYFETILKRLYELESKINTIDIKITKMEKEFLVLGCKLETKFLPISASNSIMEELD